MSENDQNDGGGVAVASRRRSLDGTDGPVRAQDFDWFFVRLTHPALNQRNVFRSVSEKRARAFIERRYPRGSEAHLVLPDGSAEHYEAERAGEYGMDADPWAPFDPDSWLPPDQQAPPGESAWSDKEG
jgi:hypothetical protein